MSYTPIWPESAGFEVLPEITYTVDPLTWSTTPMWYRLLALPKMIRSPGSAECSRLVPYQRLWLTAQS